MLSILIPIYNFHCTDLIESLHQQGKNARIPFEIICLDDGSKAEFNNSNRLLERLEYCHYHENRNNLGRSKSRNKLATLAQYDNILFIDCDSKLTTNSYIRIYADVIDGSSVIYGGRIYTSKKPVFNQKWMHWKYGTERESRNIEMRKRNPYLWFHSNNFILPKDLFLSFKFDESLTKYGYEDSLLSSKFKQANIPIIHVDNPVVHLDIMNNDQFLEKAQLALQNLHTLLQNNPKLPVRLAKSYKTARIMGLSHPIKFIYKKYRAGWERQILEGTASLRLFDWYRLGYLLCINETDE